MIEQSVSLYGIIDVLCELRALLDREHLSLAAADIDIAINRLQAMIDPAHDTSFARAEIEQLRDSA